MVDDGSGQADGTTSSDTTGNLNKNDVIDGGSGGAEGTKSSWSVDIDAGINPSSGVVIDGGSGAAEGAIKSSSVVEVAGNLCTNTVIDRGSGAAEGTKLSSSDAGVAVDRCRSFVDDGPGVVERMKSPSSTVEIRCIDDNGWCSDPRYLSVRFPFSLGSSGSSVLRASNVRTSGPFPFSVDPCSGLMALAPCSLFIFGAIISIADCRLFMNR